MSYSDYLYTNYSLCGMEDYNADRDDQILCEQLYDKGLAAFKIGNYDIAEDYYQQSLEIGARLCWDEQELPKYD